MKQWPKTNDREGITVLDSRCHNCVFNMNCCYSFWCLTSVITIIITVGLLNVIVCLSPYVDRAVVMHASSKVLFSIKQHTSSLPSTSTPRGFTYITTSLTSLIFDK